MQTTKASTKTEKKTPKKAAALPRTLCEVGPTSEPGLDTYSPFCLKVIRALRLLGVGYDSRHGMPSAFADLNPQRQVPVMLFGDEPVSDSTNILQRLDAESGGRLTPSDPRAAAECYLWEELADTALNSFVLASRWADDDNWPRLEKIFFGEIPEPARADVSGPIRRGVLDALVGRDVWRAGADACWARFEATLGALDARAPSAGFWLGDEICTADLALFAQLWSLRSSLTPRQAGRLEAHPGLMGYLQRVDQATR